MTALRKHRGGSTRNEPQVPNAADWINEKQGRRNEEKGRAVNSRHTRAARSEVGSKTGGAEGLLPVWAVQKQNPNRVAPIATGEVCEDERQRDAESKPSSATATEEETSTHGDECHRHGQNERSSEDCRGVGAYRVNGPVLAAEVREELLQQLQIEENERSRSQSMGNCGMPIAAEVVVEEEESRTSKRYEEQIDHEVQRRLQEQLERIIGPVAVSNTGNPNKDESVGRKGMSCRRRLALAVIALLAVAGVAAIAVFPTRPDIEPSLRPTAIPATIAPTSEPTRWNSVSPTPVTIDQIASKVEELVGDKIYEIGSSYQKAFNWLITAQKNSAKIIGVRERFLLALFYFSTTENGTVSWKEGGQHHNPRRLDGQSPNDLGGPLAEGAELPPPPQIAPGYSPWLSGDNICEWYGVTCTTDERFVTGIFLRGNNLHGTLPPELWRLKELDWLELHNNSIGGSIPTEYGLLSNLRVLDLAKNNLVGTFPQEMYDTESLQKFNLGNNNMSGTIPAVPPDRWLWMSELSLKRNRFLRAVPTGLGGLQKLVSLDLAFNDFEGKVPSSLGNLTWLETLRLEGNSFSGAMPEEICNLKSSALVSLTSDCAEVDCICCTECFNDTSA